MVIVINLSAFGIRGKFCVSIEHFFFSKSSCSRLLTAHIVKRPFTMSYFSFSHMRSGKIIASLECAFSLVVRFAAFFSQKCTLLLSFFFLSFSWFAPFNRCFERECIFFFSFAAFFRAFQSALVCNFDGTRGCCCLQVNFNGTHCCYC